MTATPPPSQSLSPASPVPPARRHVGAEGLGAAARELPLRPIPRDAFRERRRHRRDLEIAVTAVVGMAAVLDGPLVWLVAGLLLAATALGTLQLLSDEDGSVAERGVPIESLFVPAIAAFGAVGAIRLVPLGPLLVPALIAVALVLDLALAGEARLARAVQAPDDEERTTALVTMLIVALVAFTGVAAMVPGGLAGTEPPGAPVPPLPVGGLVVLALADAAVAGLLGYRAAALRTASVRDALWAAASYAVAIAIGAAAVRAMGIPRLIGPALLMFLFYLWDTLHSAPPSRRRDPRWLWETAILIALGLGVVAWNLRLES